jgi:hypothetical protein
MVDSPGDKSQTIREGGTEGRGSTGKDSRLLKFGTEDFLERIYPYTTSTPKGVLITLDLLIQVVILRRLSIQAQSG